MGNDVQKQNYRPIGIVASDSEGGPRWIESPDDYPYMPFVDGDPIYAVEPALYEIGRKMAEVIKRQDAERFEQIPATVEHEGIVYGNWFTIPVQLGRELEAFMDAAGRTAPLADKAEDLFLSGRASERWIKVAKDWQIGAAFANPSVGCTLQLTEDGYSAALVEAPSW